MEDARQLAQACAPALRHVRGTGGERVARRSSAGCVQDALTANATTLRSPYRPAGVCPAKKGRLSRPTGVCPALQVSVPPRKGVLSALL